MIRILKETHFDFIKARKKTFVVSAIFILAGIVSLFVRGGFNYGIDFSGGSLIQLHFEKPISTADLRKALTDIGYKKAKIQKFGTANDFLIKTIARETFVTDTVGPTIIETNVEVHEENKLNLLVTASDKNTGNGTITDVQFFLDSLGEIGKGIEMSSIDVYDSSVEKAVVTIPTYDWKPETSHKIYIRAKDSNGNWSNAKEITVNISESGMEIPKETQGKSQVISTSSKPSDSTSSAMLKTKLQASFPDNNLRIDREEMVGPAVSRNLQWKALWVILVGMFAILIYVSFRFTFRFGIGAVIALFHDIIITIGILSIMGKEFTVPIVAAILTIVGYSINDTIVISDRIRENLKRLRKQGFAQIINESINQTLSRTIITSLTTFVALLVLFLIGGKVIHDFSLALLIGVIVGTYSSVFVVAPIVYEWEVKSPTRKRK